MVKETKNCDYGKKKTAVAMKTAAMAGEKIAAAIKTAATTRTTAMVETVAAAMETSKIFREGAIIPAKKKTAIVAAEISRKNNAASFNKREKYIWITSNAAAFA